MLTKARPWAVISLTKNVERSVRRTRSMSRRTINQASQGSRPPVSSMSRDQGQYRSTKYNYNSPADAGRQGEGGYGWQKGGGYRRSAWTRDTFRKAVPLPWLVIAVGMLVEVGSAAYVQEFEDFDRLIQRCNFHIDAAAAGDVTDVSSSHDLLEAVYDAAVLEHAWPDTLPKLLDAGVLSTALRGAQSPDPKMAVFYLEILNLLSLNEHVAAMMASEPSCRSFVVEEVRRQFSEGDLPIVIDDHMFPLAPERIGDPFSADGAVVPSEAEGLHEHLRRRLAGSSSKPVQEDSSNNEALSRHSENGEDGRKNGEGHQGASDTGGAGGAMDVERTVVLDPLYANLTLRTLSNVMRASRSITGGSSSSAGGGDREEGRSAEVAFNMTSGLRRLFCANNYAEQKRREGLEPAEGQPVAWPLEQKLVDDLAELLLSITKNDEDMIRSMVQSFAGDSNETNEGVGMEDVLEALKGLECAAASVLLQVSRDPDLVPLLMRKRIVYTLVSVRERCKTASALQIVSETTMNLCSAYRRIHALEPVKQSDIAASDFVRDVLKLWSRQLRAEERTRVQDLGLGATPEAAAMIEQAERTVVNGSSSMESVAQAMYAASALVYGLAWGGVRRWITWRRTGETFAAASRWVLPRVLIWTGLRAGLGAVALTATHGVNGLKSRVKHKRLDATSGPRGSWPMCAWRNSVELGYLYAVLRLCPYSIAPTVLVYMKADRDGVFDAA